MYKLKLTIISIILVVFSTIAYSGLATSLAITGEANIRAVSDIRVTDISLNATPNGGVEQYSSKYTKNTVTTGFLLSNSTYSISYDVTIKNNGETDQVIYGISKTSNNNGVHILVDGEEINDQVPIFIGYKTTKTITLTYSTSNPSNETINVITTFDFREVYYITYNSQGGSSIAIQTKYQNVDINITNDRPTKTGYIFLSWNDASNGSGVSYSPGGSYTLNSNKTLYAQYQNGTYQITLDDQNATTSATASIYEKYDMGYYLESGAVNQMTTSTNGIVVPQKDGYVFGGYYTSTNGQGVQYIDDTGKLTSNADASHFSDVGTLYAKWTANVMTINYYANGAQKDNNVNLSNQLLRTETFDYDSNIGSSGTILSSSGLPNYDDGIWKLTKTGYHADKYWHVGTANASVKVFENTAFTKSQDLSNVMEKLEDFKDGDITVNIYAGWTANTYTITYKGNNSTSGTTASSSHTYDTAKALTTNGFSRTGYSFTGWNTQADGSGTPYLNNASVTNLADVDNGNVDLYAQWTPNTFTVIFNKNHNDATGSMSNQTFTYDVAQNLTSNTFSRTGYKMVGWNTQADGNGTSYSDAQSVSNLVSSGNITLYAKWQRVMAENVEHEEDELNCTDSQCMVDEIYYMLY